MSSHLVDFDELGIEPELVEAAAARAAAEGRELEDVIGAALRDYVRE